MVKSRWGVSSGENPVINHDWSKVDIGYRKGVLGSVSWFMAWYRFNIISEELGMIPWRIDHNLTQEEFDRHLPVIDWDQLYEDAWEGETLKQWYYFNRGSYYPNNVSAFSKWQRRISIDRGLFCWGNWETIVFSLNCGGVTLTSHPQSLGCVGGVNKF